MTAIIGFATEEFLIIASDSQVSYQGEAFKRPGQQKIVDVHFPDSFALVALAGDVGVGQLFLEHFEGLAVAGPDTSPRGIANLAESSLKHVRDKLLNNYFHETLGTDASRDYFATIPAEFLLGYYYQREPHIYRLELRSATAIRCFHPFEAIGSGANIASMILSAHDVKKLRSDHIFGLAAYVIEMCKRHDPYCGGRIQIGVLGNASPLVPPFFFPEKVRKTFEEAANAVEQVMSAKLVEEIAAKYHELAELYKMRVTLEDPKDRPSA